MREYVMNIKDLYNKNAWIFVLLFTTVVSVIFVTACFWLTNLNIESNMQTDINKLYCATLIILTFILVCVAWIQLHKLQRISQSDFLLKIFHHLSDNSIIKAMKIIHRLRLNAEDEIRKRKDYTSTAITEDIRSKIRELRFNSELISEFIILKNFLDYLEHIAYLCNKKEISIEDIEKCLSERLSTYYDYYEDLIEFYREANPNHNPYKSLEILVKNFQSNKS
jgi:hypothetical protein